MLGSYLAVCVACPALGCMLEYAFTPTPGAVTGLRSGGPGMVDAVLLSCHLGHAQCATQLVFLGLWQALKLATGAGLSLCYDSCWVCVVYSALALGPLYSSDFLSTLFQSLCACQTL
jgi:hypothetical protein